MQRFELPRPPSLFNPVGPPFQRVVLKTLIGVSFSATFVVFSPFWLVHFLGIERLAQLTLYLAVVILSAPILIHRLHRYVFEPLFILSLVYLFSAGRAVLLFDRDVSVLFASSLSVLLVAAVFALTTKYCNDIWKWSIISLGVFAILGMVQFAILWFLPDLEKDVRSGVFEAHYLSGTRMAFHPLQFLGFSTGESLELFGHRVTRVSSFLKEPSVVGAYFLIPGVVALSYTKFVKLMAIPLILFALVTMSGSVWMSVLFSLIALVLLTLFGRVQWLASVFPFIALGIFVSAILLFESAGLVNTIEVVTEPWIPYASFLEKGDSAGIRLELLRQGLFALEGNFWGLPIEATTSGGLFFYTLFFTGAFGAATLLIVIYQNLRLSVRLYHRRGHRVFSAFLFGSYVQAMLLTSGGLVGPAGILVMALLLRRLREIESVSSSLEIGSISRLNERGVSRLIA